MIFPRHGCALFVVACCFTASAAAQEGTAGTIAPRTGASSSFGSSPPPGTGLATPGTAPGGSSAFGTTPPGAGPGATPGTTKPGTGTGTGTGTGGAGTGAASAFGEEQGGTRRSSDAEPAFSIPGSYGRPAQEFRAGEGRLARPKFRYSISMSVGYDDNVFQAPTDSPGTPDVVVVVPDSAGTPARTEAGIGPDGLPTVEVAPGTAPTTRKTVIPGTPGQERIGSFVTRAHGGVDIQFASRKTLFTFDLRTGGTWYWDRPGKDVDYTGSMALMYLRRLTPRMQFTASANTSTQTQPDLTQVNTSTNQAGEYFTGGGRLELSYRFTPRFSAVGNVNYNTIIYREKTVNGQDYNETGVGLELRYLWSPRFTLTGQMRYSTILYPDDPVLDANTVYALVGGEVTLSRRFSGNLLLGGSMREFEEGGKSATSPYGELTLTYQLAKATVLQVNGRYGFEAPPTPDSELVSLRGGVNLVQSFSPRLRGTLGTTFVRQTTTFTGTDLESVTNTVDSTIGFEFTLTRTWTLNANYTYITQFSTNSFNDYYRNQIFFGGQYVF